MKDYAYYYYDDPLRCQAPLSIHLPVPWQGRQLNGGSTVIVATRKRDSN